MNSRTFRLEVITPCFCAGAAPEEQAEIRAPSIRGQLRWWFRVLGGFRALSLPLARQEAEIFGSAAGDRGAASPLVVRVAPTGSVPLRSTLHRDAAQMHATVRDPRGYLLWPLQNKPRAAFDLPQLPTFELRIQWRGDPERWQDIEALIAILGHLGALGFRSRRAMGALGFAGPAPDLAAALRSFARPDSLVLRQLPARNAHDAIDVLARWLKGWRAHGRTQDHDRARPGEPPDNAGFDYARRDHDVGLGLHRGPVFRPALGLPIIQNYSQGRRRANWEWDWDPKRRRGTGRFASPVLLRPHRDGGGWRALVIFVESRRWPVDKSVFVDGRRTPVSMELYEKMKADLPPFP